MKVDRYFTFICLYFYTFFHTIYQKPMHILGSPNFTWKCCKMNPRMKLIYFAVKRSRSQVRQTLPALVFAHLWVLASCSSKYCCRHLDTQLTRFWFTPTLCWFLIVQDRNFDAGLTLAFAWMCWYSIVFATTFADVQCDRCNVQCRRSAWWTCVAMPRKARD